jgi:hypothetical protein
MPAMVILAGVLSYTYNKENVMRFLSNESRVLDATTLVSHLDKEESDYAKYQVSLSDPEGYKSTNGDLEAYLSKLDESAYNSTIQSLRIPETKKFEGGWDVFKHKIPTWIFIFTSLLLTYWAWTKNLSLIPLLGLVSCLYMMSEMGVSNWMGFGIWLVVGLIIYFSFSYKNSKLNLPEAKS